MKNKKIKQKFFQRSFISIATLMIASALLLLAIYFLNFVLSEIRIVESHTKSVQAYYLAEAGVNEAIWKLKNDHQDESEDGDKAWADEFVTEPNCENFSDSFTRDTNNIFPNSSYTVSIQNTACAKGEIVVTAYINLPNGSRIQRIVETKVFKPLNPSPTRDSAVFSGGETESINFLAGYMNIYKGNIFSNYNITLDLISTLRAYDDPETEDIEEGKVVAVNNIYKSLLSTIVSTGRCAKNVCDPSQACVDAGFTCPPSPVSMPMIDFDSSDPNSYKSRAEALGSVYTAQEFENLLWDNPTYTLNSPVTYVTGPIELKGNQRLIVNGVLVADGSISVGEELCWYKSLFQWRCGNSRITVNHSEGNPSGILTKRNVEVGLFADQIDINGLLYAGDEFSLVSVPSVFNIVGGMVARDLNFVSIWQGLNITLNDDFIRETIGTPLYSPVIQIEHWEESY